MRKFLILVLMAFSLAIPTALATSPAQASGCINDKVRTGSSIRVHTEYTDWDVRGILVYDECDNYANFERYSVQTIPLDHCENLTSWKFNPNVIGNFNPGDKTVACNNNGTVTTWYSPTYNYIFPSDPSNEKCIGTFMNVALSQGEPDQFYDIPTICVTFH